MILSIGALLIFMGVAGFFVVEQSQRDIIEYQAVEIAEIVVKQATVVRQIYNDNIVEKLKADGTGYAEVNHHEVDGTVPLPAQFIKSVSDKASSESNGLFSYRSVSKWNLSPDQGLTSEF